MEKYYAVVFRSLPLVEGHFLWPRYKVLGGGFFLCRMPDSVLKTSSGLAREEDTMIAVQTIFSQVLGEQHFGTVQPVSRPILVDMKSSIPEDIRTAVLVLQSDMKCGYLLSVDPPPSMPPSERALYRIFDKPGGNN
jgi:hypothetical protein